MNTSEALEHFGSRRGLAAAAGVTIQAVGQWIRADRIPEKHQYLLEIVTEGALKADQLTKSKQVTHGVSALLEQTLYDKAAVIGSGNRAEGIRIALAAYGADSHTPNEGVF